MANIVIKKQKVLAKIKKTSDVSNQLLILSKESNVKNKKVIKKTKLYVFLSICLILFSSIFSITLYSIYNSKVSVATSSFNSKNSFNDWNEYINNHKKNQYLINLNRVAKYFSNSENRVLIDTNNKKNLPNEIKFSYVLKKIDQKLIETNFEENTLETNSDNKLPNNFFQNVILNPAVRFTNKDNKNIDNHSFKSCKKYNEVKQYIIKMKIDKTAKNFGLNIDNNDEVFINIDISNNTKIDISNLDLKFKDQTIWTDQPESTLKKMLDENIQITDYIKNVFANTIKNNTVNLELPTNSYKVIFKNIKDEKKLDFSKNTPIKFSIIANKNKIFKGKIQKAVNVISAKIDLKKETALLDKVKNLYVKAPMPLKVNNNTKNDKTNLSTQQLNQAKNEICKKIKEICNSYFADKYSQLKVSDVDYLVEINNLIFDKDQKNDIYNNGNGKEVKILIRPNKNNKKFIPNSYPEEFSIKVIGENLNEINRTWLLPRDFKIDGICLPDGKNSNVLQNGLHRYAQDKLLNALTKDENSFLKQVKNSSLKVKNNEFWGLIKIKWKLDKADLLPSETINVSEIKKQAYKGINNFYELISRTKRIYLEINIIDTKENRTVNFIKFNFYDSDKIEQISLIYTIDLSKFFKNNVGDDVGIGAKTELEFSDFIADIYYKQCN